jgi:hypothetical protein
MTKRKDSTKINECDESEMIDIPIDEDPDFAKNKVCPKTRNESIENQKKVLEVFDILSDVDKTENMLLGLTPKERSKLYDHKLYEQNEKVRNLLP